MQLGFRHRVLPNSHKSFYFEIARNVFQRILVVCVGNICRSPIAEFLFRARLSGRERAPVVESAGIGALVGRSMDASALDVLARHGHDGQAHVARQLDEVLIRQADLILAMEPAHIAAITQRAPHATGRTFLLGKWQNDRPVRDPYRQSQAVFDRAYAVIDEAVASWTAYL